MYVIFSIIALTVFVVAVLRFRRAKATAETRTPESDKPVKAQPYARFQSVALENLVGACAAAYAIEGERFLPGEAPQVPLPECDAPVCNCRFVKHTDRRQSSNRRQQWTGAVGDSGGAMEERRDGGDRRQSDPSDYFA